jgi:preprotein translocase subunit SecG
MRTTITALAVVVNVVSMIAMIVGVLLHSGRGGGLSDMFGGGGASALGSAAAERNLNRITTVLALTWLLTAAALGILLAT